MKFLHRKSADISYLYPEQLRLSNLENCALRDGKIVFGPAFSEEKTALRFDNSAGLEMSFALTDCYVFYGGKYGRIALGIAENLLGAITYNVIFIGEDKSVIDLGYIEFSSNGESFGYPDSYTFFSGKKTMGDGIYFLCRRIYENGEEYILLREYSFEEERWILVSDSSIYAPTLLEFGRGEAYHLAGEGGIPLQFPSPQMPERKNLLSPRFTSKFTTDGMSLGFTLPLENLDDSAVTASLRLEGETFSFKIYAGEIKSEPTKVFGEDIIMYCDRGYGRVFFEKTGTGGWSIPFSSEYNNLAVTAYKTESSHAKKIAAMTRALRLSGSVVTGGESVTVFWGSRISPSCIIANSPKNPLYFPAGSEYVFGDEREIVDVIREGKYLYVFKEREVYRSLINAEKEKTVYPFSFVAVTVLPATPKKNTVTAYSGGILFADKNGNIFRLKLTTNFPCERIASGETDFDFAIGTEDKCLFIKEDTALCLQKNGQDMVVGRWKLPRRCVGSVGTNTTNFLFEKQLHNSYEITLAEQGGTRAEGSAKIAFTALKDRGTRRINAITLYGRGGQFMMIILVDGKKAVCRRGSLKNREEKLNIGAFGERVEVELYLPGDFALEKIKLEEKG